MRLLFVILLLATLPCNAQVFNNSGETITLKNNAVIHVNGASHNQSGTVDTEGGFNVTGSITNDGTLMGTGEYNIGGDWVNNNFFIGSTGEVDLNGANQNITGTSITTFNNLTLSGTGTKTMALNSAVSGILALNNHELATQTHVMTIKNPSPTAVTYVMDSGFVSSTGNGKLARAVNTNVAYIFPTGSKLGTPRYRPIEITPNSNVSDTFFVRLANVDPTVEGFDRALAEEQIVTLNDEYYHRINRSGNTPVDIRFYFDQSDGDFNRAAHWQNQPQWENTGIANLSINAAPNLSSIYIEGWNDFSYEAFALSKLQETSNNIYYIPNVFMPGGDQTENQSLFVRGENISELQLIIWNRWGEKIFATDCCCNSGCSWDGTYKGKPLNSAAFVFTLQGKFLDGEEFDEKGNIMLIR